MSSCEWYEDPSFDDFEEAHNGRVYKGEAWRRLICAKEQGADIVQVAGTSFRKEAIASALKQPYPVVSLEAEASNAFDENAIKVDISGEHVGYIPKSMNSSISPGSRARLIHWGISPGPHITLAVSA